MGDSTSPPNIPSGIDEFTMETLARDLAFLIGHLGWKEAAFLGFSMGGRKLFSTSFYFIYSVPRRCAATNAGNSSFLLT
jgi:pimeloyl-ACP methyl ester carboxylesterase